MLINRHTLAQELLALNLISRAAIVDGGFRVQERFGRNRVFAAHLAHQPIFLIKQAVPSRDSWRNQTLLREAACLEFASDIPELRKHVPAIRHVDSRNQLIIQEFIPGENLHGAVFPSGDYASGELSAAIDLAAQIGTTLAVIHRQMHPLLDTHRSTTNPVGRPTILSQKNLWQVDRISQGSPLMAFAAVMKKSPDIETALTRMGESWQSDAWIHHDMKLNNGILASGEDGNPERVVFIDWELAGPGDRAWDVAGLIHTMIARAIHAQDRREAAADANEPDPGGITLAQAAEISTAACNAYLDESRSDGNEFRERCLAYTGARLVQLASEFLLDGHSINSNVLFLLQAGSNLLQNPLAFRQFAGLSD